MPAFDLIPSFNGGEVSPMLDARTALEKYKSACRTLENFVIMPYGGVNRRPGLAYVGEAKNANKKARLIGFNYSTTTRFIIEFGDYYGRVWASGGTTYLDEFVSPYSADQLADFKFVQANDVLYFVHPSFPPYKLSRISDSDWTFAEITWVWPAFKDENDGAITLTPSGTTGSITLTASAALFVAADVGTYFQVSHNRLAGNANDGIGSSASYIAININATWTSATLKVFGKWEFTTSGTWTAMVVIEKENLSGAWEIVRTYESRADRNVSTSGDFNEETNMRIRMPSYTSGSGVARLDAVGSRVYGVAKITAFTSSTVVTATVVKTLSATTATLYWAEGAWSAKSGYPRAIAMHDSRLYFSGSTAQPVTVWGSAIDDFEDIRLGTTDEDAFTFTLFASEQNRINWMVSREKLMIGTVGDEWTVESSDDTKTLSATNVKATRQSRYGSNSMQAIILSEVLLFIQRGSRKVRELSYSFEKDGWVAADLTLLSEHLTRSFITAAAFQQSPDAIMWAITGDGQIIGMTYERDQNVVGWHRHTTDGVVESVATIYGNGTEDEVWFIIKRTINGIDRRFIEKFSLNWRYYLDNSTVDSWRYLDSYIESPTNAFPVQALATVTVEVGTALEITLSDSLFTLELADGDIITFTGVLGTTQLNRQVKVKTPTGVTYGQYWVLVDPVTDVPIDADGWGTYTSGGTATFQNLYAAPVLSGKSVQVFTTGGGVATTTATNGRVPSTSQPLAVGIPYTSTLTPMKLHLDLQDGTSIGRKARIHGIIARLYKSRGGEAMTNAGKWYALGAESGVFTGDRKITLAGNYAEDADLTVRQTKPFPLTLLALVPKWEAFGSE